MPAAISDTSSTPAATTAPNSIVNLSGYRFVALDNLAERQVVLSDRLQRAGVRGTVLLAAEGINVALAGEPEAIGAARAVLEDDPCTRGLWLKESLSDTIPFARLKVRVRREIIAFDGEDAVDRAAVRPVAPSISPETLSDWLADGCEFTLLDTRNAYEVASGTFTRAEQLDIGHFREFGDAVKSAVAAGKLDPERTVVTFCTGGVRCEKAAPWLLEHGFRDVRQIEGGVLNWFAQCGGAHWDGDCFVFDDRVEIDPSLAPTGARLCTECHRAVPLGDDCGCQANAPV